MNGRSRASSLAASPTMVGAVTTLIVVVAVFLAYNANNGLPFVPVYRVSAEMCNAARLGPNNEVRIGGNRVGVVESIEPVDLESSSNAGRGGACVTDSGSSASTAAKLNLKLDDSAKPLPDDSTIRVRYRSSFGLKYLEIVRGNGPGLAEGATLPIEQAQEQVEFDDVGNTFDTATRESSRRSLVGFGDAFAGRGASLNQAIEALNPLFTNLKPVSKALAEPSTDLVRFFPELADAARIIAPVAEDQAQFFTNAAISFGAISEDERALRDTISGGPPTLREGIQSLPVERPFLHDFAEFSRLLRPGVHDLRISLPDLNGAVSLGAKTLPKTVQMNRDLEDVMRELERLVDEPSTTRPGAKSSKVALERLGQFFDEASNLGGKVAPYQTVCNYWDYWFTFLTEHITEADQVGFAQRVALVTPPGATGPPNEYPRNPLADYGGGQADGLFSDLAGPNAGLFAPREQPILHANPYGPAGSASAPNCQPGQTGYVLGNFPSPGQTKDSPAFGVHDISAATGIPKLGKTDLFWFKNGTRTFAAP